MIGTLEYLEQFYSAGATHNVSNELKVAKSLFAAALLYSSEIGSNH